MPYFEAILEIIDPKKDQEILQIHKDYLQKYIDEGKIFAKGPEGSRRLTLKEWKSTLPD